MSQPQPINNNNNNNKATCCPICLEPFQSTTTISSTTINRVPRMLWCGHTFCTHCLSQLIPSSTLPTTTKETQIQCPIDRKFTTLHPSNNNKSTSMVEELPINRAVMDMLSMLSFSPTPSPSSPSSIPLKCHECEQDDATLYCEDCKANFCQACDEMNHATKFLRSHKRTSPPLLPSSNSSTSSSSNIQRCDRHVLDTYCLMLVMDLRKEGEVVMISCGNEEFCCCEASHHKLDTS